MKSRGSQGVLDNGNRVYSDSNPPETLMMTEFAAGGVTTPPAGKAVLFSPDGSALMIKDDAGVVRTVGSATGTKVSALAAVSAGADSDEFVVNQGGTSKKITLSQMNAYHESRGRVVNGSTANQAFTTGDTYIIGSSCPIPAGRLQAKTVYRMRMQLTKTSTTGSTATPLINVRVGTAGTTADASRCLLTFAAQTAVADAGFIDVYINFRSVGGGTSAVLSGSALLDHQLAVTGLANVNTSCPRNVGGGFDSTVANLIIGCSFTGGTSFAGNTDLVQSELMNLA